MKFIVIIVPVILDHYILLQNFPHFSAFFTSRNQGLWLRLGWGQDCELHLPQGSHRLNWLCSLTCWIHLFVCCEFKAGNLWASEWISMGLALFYYFGSGTNWWRFRLFPRRKHGLILLLPYYFFFKKDIGLFSSKVTLFAHYSTNTLVFPSVSWLFRGKIPLKHVIYMCVFYVNLMVGH